MSELLTTRNKVPFDPRTHPLTAVWGPSVATGPMGEKIAKNLVCFASNLSPTLRQAYPTEKKVFSVAEQLHDALGTAKILLSQISMHLDKAWRDKLFRQLDDLLDIDSWDEADKVLDNGSFATFLRMILYHRPDRRPALGISHRGHLLADWTVDGESLTIEFLPKDEVRWVLMHFVNGDRETAGGQTQLGRLNAVLSPYKPSRWFVNADQS